MPVINAYNLFLSSANRTSGTSDAFRLQLFRPITLKSPNNWFTCRVGSCEIPYTYKLINSANNVINFVFIRNGVTYESTVTIAPGNYNILQLLDEFKSELIQAIQSLASYTPPLVFTYDRATGKATFSIEGTDSVTTNLYIPYTSPVFMRCLGMTSMFQIGYTSPSSRTDATSNQNVNVFQNPAVYVRSDTLIQTQNVECLIGTQSEPSDILAKIQVNVLPQTMILWTNATDLRVELTNKIIDEISLYLGSSTSYSLDLGNLDWSIRLTLEEHTDDVEEKDLAINLSRGTDPYVEDLMSKRQELLANLQKQKDLLLQDATKKRSRKASQGEG